MKFEVRDYGWNLLTTVEIPDSDIESTHKTIACVDVIRADGKRARGFISAKVVRGGCSFELVAKQQDASQVERTAVARFKAIKP